MLQELPVSVKSYERVGLERLYYETLEWAQIFVQQPLPFSSTEPPYSFVLL